MRGLKLLVAFVVLFVACTLTSKAQEKSSESDEVFLIVEDMPEYPGGDDALRSDITQLVKYPKEAKEKGIQGKVFVSFVVDKKGKIGRAEIARGVDPLLDKEALRVVNALSKTWQPGKQRGTAVNIRFTVPINFALDKDKKSDGAKASQSKKKGDVFFIVEKMPEYPGGQDQLRMDIANTVKYPEEAVKANKQGKVYITFNVNKYGKIETAKIARGVCPSLDKEALRVVNNLDKNWSPGMEKGKAVTVQYTVPINFALN